MRPFSLVVVALWVSASTAGISHANTDTAPAVTRVAPGPDIPHGLRCLWHAYPEHICRVSANSLVWCDGTEMVYDTGRKHASHDDLLNAPDLEDMMAMRYPPGAAAPTPPPENFEPGRVRYEPFFLKMYGDSRKAVSRRTRKVRWRVGSSGDSLRVTTVNEVDEQLTEVAKALHRLPHEIRRYVEKTSGAFNWRVISGTPRRSMHSFAVAVDVGVKYANYWKWARGKGSKGTLTYRNRIPMEVVTLFEAHGFIWGGKWYHYDTMHFEYRPELLHPLCAR